MRPESEIIAKHQPYDIERVVTDFAFEKNGMRFPSHVEITTTHHSVVAGNSRDELRTSIVQTLTQDYSRFEFYSVRSSDEIMRFVNGERPLASVPANGRQIPSGLAVPMVKCEVDDVFPTACWY